MNATGYSSCDLCGSGSPRFILDASGLDGPLVECLKCGFRYVGNRRSGLTFGSHSADDTTEKVRAANQEFRQLGLKEEHRLASLNAQWRLDLIRTGGTARLNLPVAPATTERVAR